MTDVSVMPKMQMITPELVRASIKRARKSLEAAAREIVWQIEMESWVTLGYSSWTAMREAEYGGAAFMVPSKSRPEIVTQLKAIEVGRTSRGGSKHLTDQEIADTVGVDRDTVVRDRHEHYKKPQIRQNVAEPASDDDVIDAEIVEDDPEPVVLETGPRPEPNRELELVNDIREQLNFIGTSTATTNLSPKAKQHIIEAANKMITNLQRS